MERLWPSSASTMSRMWSYCAKEINEYRAAREVLKTCWVGQQLSINHRITNNGHPQGRISPGKSANRTSKVIGLQLGKVPGLGPSSGQQLGARVWQKSGLRLTLVDRFDVRSLGSEGRRECCQIGGKPSKTRDGYFALQTLSEDIR